MRSPANSTPATIKSTTLNCGTTSAETSKTELITQFKIRQPRDCQFRRNRGDLVCRAACVFPFCQSGLMLLLRMASSFGLRTKNWIAKSTAKAARAQI